MHLQNNLANPLQRKVKRLFDCIGAIFLLFLFSPLMLWVALKIARTSGWPVIFSQARVGKSGKLFKFYKFRTMVLNAETVIEQWEQNNSQEWQRYVASNFKLDDDPRVIGVGQFLRRTSLDELPQLWNVLKGDMSLVGPRPLLPREIADYGEDMHYYEEISPGITGLWQISGRSQTNFQDRIKFDVWYVKNWSLWNDITILLRTVRVVLNRSGAY